MIEKIVEKADAIIIWLFGKGTVLLLLTILFLTGFVFGVAATYNDSPQTQAAIGEGRGIGAMTARVISPLSPEKDSPFDWIKEDQIHVYDDRVVIELKNAEWATFTDTNSMDPVIDYGANAIEIVPKSTGNIHVGDIISYNSEYASGTIIHRVVEIGEDSAGWYVKTKGDNNHNTDPGKIRFSQVQRIVVAVIY